MRLARFAAAGLLSTALLLLGATAAWAGPAADPGGPQQLSSRAIPADPAWRAYVLDQYGGLVYPKHVYVIGDPSAVQNPAGLEAPGGGVTTIRATGQGTPSLALDLGIDTGGYVEVGITKSDGATVHLGYAEARRFLTPDGDIMQSPLYDRQDDVAGVGNWRSPAVRGGERWIWLQLQSAGTVSIDYVRVREDHVPATVADYAGHFLSNDDLLNRIWYAGAYTFVNDSLKTSVGNFEVVDGAKRDRMLWLGDLAIENLTGEDSVRQAPQIIRSTLQAFSCQQAADGQIAAEASPGTICPDTPPPPSSSPSPVLLPEYTAWWVIGVHDYWMDTGDDAFVERMLPVARRAVAYFSSHLDANGLYSTPSGPGVVLNWHPFDVASGEDTHTNATIYRALMDIAEMESRLGAGRAAAIKYEQEAQALRQAIVSHLWDPSAGAFLLNATDPMRNHTEDAQVEAVLDGVVVGAQAEDALRFLDNHLATTYGIKNGEFDDDPYMSNYISPYIGSTDLLARFSQHDTLSALELMRREWGHMADTDPNTTFWEKMNFQGDAATYTPNQQGIGLIPNTVALLGQGSTSLSHGWSTGPTPALSSYVLGIQPVTPGYRTWLVEPQPEGLRWAQGQVTTEAGGLASRWQLGANNGSFRLTVAAPPGTTGTVAVPSLGASRVLFEDGRLVWDGSRARHGAHATIRNGYVSFATVSGTHTWAWEAHRRSTSCARASGRLDGRILGLISLGMTRDGARNKFPSYSKRGRRYMDFFCLAGGAGIRVGYPAAKLLRALSPAERARVQGRVVLALTASRYYELRGVRPGTQLGAVARALGTGRGSRIGLNWWYVIANGLSRGVLKVRHGVIEEIGIADVALTSSRPAVWRFLNSFA